MVGLPALPDALSLPPIWRETRTPLEAAGLYRSPVWRGEGIPHGDGDPVLLVCGFLAGDGSLGPMAGWLKRIGHRPSRAGIRWNVDCTAQAVDRLEARVEALAERTGSKVAIVGQSRGGTFARAIAVRRPDLVRAVVGLGSPLRDHLDVHPAVRVQVRAFALLGSVGVPGLFSKSCRDGACCEQVRKELEAPMPPGVSFTSIYSKSDGIVRWRACLDQDAQHVEVRASHIGMAMHDGTYRAIARALSPVEVPVTADVAPTRAAGLTFAAA